MKTQSEIEITKDRIAKGLTSGLAAFCVNVNETRKEFDSLMKALEKITNKRDLTPKPKQP